MRLLKSTSRLLYQIHLFQIVLILMRKNIWQIDCPEGSVEDLQIGKQSQRTYRKIQFWMMFSILMNGKENGKLQKEGKQLQWEQFLKISLPKRIWIGFEIQFDLFRTKNSFSVQNQILWLANLLNSKTWKTFDDNEQCHFAIKGQSSYVDRGNCKFHTISHIRWVISEESYHMSHIIWPYRKVFSRSAGINDF